MFKVFYSDIRTIVAKTKIAQRTIVVNVKLKENLKINILKIEYRTKTRTKGKNMDYKEQIENIWNKAGGLITKTTASRILKVSKSVISRREDIKKYKIGKDEFVSFSEILNREDIKPRKKRNESIEFRGDVGAVIKDAKTVKIKKALQK